MNIRSTVLAAIAAAGFTAAPVQAQGINLPPDVYGALTELYQASAFRCQSGMQDACNAAAAVEDYAHQMSQAFYWCQMNDPNACQFYQMGVQEIAMQYQQYQANMAAQGFPRTPQQHQQIMQQNQQSFDAYQQGYWNQQRANDEAHQRFIQSIRGE